jgi:hypothetical protein
MIELLQREFDPDKSFMIDLVNLSKFGKDEESDRLIFGLEVSEGVSDYIEATLVQPTSEG